jgi:hypothetical protein
MMFESATTVLVTCLALGSLVVVLTLVLVAMRTPQPQPQPVRVRADDGLRARGGQSPYAHRDRGCNGIDR